MLTLQVLIASEGNYLLLVIFGRRQHLVIWMEPSFTTIMSSLVFSQVKQSIEVMILDILYQPRSGQKAATNSPVGSHIVDWHDDSLKVGNHSYSGSKFAKGFDRIFII